jgi:sigma-B regulation protein RsbU (phosphoserine phosphatase)
MIVPLVTRGKTIGIIGMTNKDSEYAFTKNSMELAETVASQIATALDNAQLHAQTEKALDVAERDLEIGREIQSGFFPQFMPSIPGWEVSTYFKAARQVSGDFYDVFPIGKTRYFGIVVADVCDKGVGAALFMVLLRSLVRFYSEQYQKEVLVEEMLDNMALSVNNYIVNNHGQSNMFATLVLSILDPESGKLYYVNGGPDSPVLVDANGQIKDSLNPTGPAFGFSTELTFEYGAIDFMPGDLLLSFTDGFTLDYRSKFRSLTAVQEQMNSIYMNNIFKNSFRSPLVFWLWHWKEKDSPGRSRGKGRILRLAGFHLWSESQWIVWTCSNWPSDCQQSH